MAQKAMRAKAREIDFTNTKGRGPYNPKYLEAGDYVATIVGVLDQKSKAGDDMWVYAFQLDDMASAVYPYYCVLNADNAWKIRTVFEAAGVKVPNKVIDVDPNKVTGRKVLISLGDDEYDGKPKSVIEGIMSVSELDVADDDEDDEPPVKTSRSTKRKPAPVEDDDDEDDDEDEPVKKAPAKKRKPAPEPEDDDEEEDEDEPPVRKPSKRRKPAPVEDNDEDEEEDEDEPPARKKRAPAKSSKRRAKADDDEYDEMDVDDL